MVINHLLTGMILQVQPKLFKKLRTASPLRKAITDEKTTSVKIREATVVSSNVRMIQMPCPKAFVLKMFFLRWDM